MKFHSNTFVVFSLFKTSISIKGFATKFTEVIQNRTVYSDANIALSCGKVDGSPKPKITWTRSESLLKNWVSLQFFHIISNFEEIPSVVTNLSPFQPSTEDSTEFPSFKNLYFPDDTVHQSGYKDNGVDMFTFNAFSNANYVDAAGNLILKSLSPKNQGWYKCEASNVLGIISNKMYLQVKSEYLLQQQKSTHFSTKLIFPDKIYQLIE